MPSATEEKNQSKKSRQEDRDEQYGMSPLPGGNLER